MGEVFEARHVSLNTRAAVKVLSPGLESEKSFRQRFQREAELQAQLRHPNVARVLDYLEDGGQWFLVVEYLERGSLGDFLARSEKVSRPQALAWIRQALAGLGHAHAKGIVHRDIKPANLLLGDSGEIVVADFGIARGEGAPGLTTTGVAVGTPHYMSPEQIVTPERVDQRSDIYSLGIVLYELLAGRKPFDAASQFAVLQAQVSEPPPPLQAIDASIPPQLDAVVMRALSKKPEERYADCASMLRDLDRPAEAPAGSATIHASVLLDRVAVEQPSGPSPGELRDRKRRSYQRRLAAGVMATLATAALFAFRLAKDNARPPDGGSNPPVVSVTASSSTQPPAPNSTTPVVHSGGSKPYRPSENTSSIVQPTPPAPVPKQAPVPSPLPPLPERPRVAVIGTGDDPLLAAGLEQEMERRLRDGFDVADEQGEPAVAELLRSKGANVGVQDLGKALLENGFHVLVLLRVEKGESRTTSVHGIDGSIKAARMRLNAYMLPTHRPIGNGWTEGAEYTELSAGSTARKAFIGPTADLRAAIDSEWSRLRTAGGAP
jgi:serine/threonine-protein kinase